MEVLFYILVVLACLASIGSLVLLFFIASFLVKMRDRHDQFFNDVVMMIAGFELPEAPVVVHEEKKAKTWDEKYEEELTLQERRMRSDSGLSDLPPPKATFGEAPAANVQAQEGLIFRDRTGNIGT